MAMDQRKRAEFVNGYTRALISAWSSEEYAARLRTDARAALAEAGLELPAEAEIVIVTTVPEGEHEGNLEKQVDLYEAGLETGRFEFHIPETPQIDTAELSEGDLSDIAAGGTSCCCPCSCCT
ncbi:hypothetical protein GCM10010260_26550 [Streptomyces filipinensis]|uniref:Nitrile hydratase alpha /Thiocyanate hydrolase gamma domain-containing protein n=1 Tax=Streptomyces filipinensis TaxID=66887 RepID=A0A918IB93_9ACTN|nr:hypothetical protein [Streptomyces filipinensis]GGU90693.1 hypothetical protein GCM10010260_26550 [Streptomyces filipinensis]